MSQINEKTSLLATVGAAAVSLVLAIVATGTIAFGFVTGYASQQTPGQYAVAQAQAVVADTAPRS